MERSEESNTTKVLESVIGMRYEYEHYKYEDGSWLSRCTVFLGRKAMSVGYSICSSRDNFNREKGRLISKGRALKALSNHQTLSPRKRTDNLALRELARLGLHAKAYYRN